MQKQFLLLVSLVLLSIYVVNAQTWEKVAPITGSGFEESEKMVRDNDGNSYVVGKFTNNISFGTITLSDTGTVFLAKLDSNGNGIWARSFQILTSSNVQYDIQIDSSKNVYLVGIFRTVNPVDFGNGVLLSGSSNGTFNQGFVTKFDNNGQTLWTSSISSAQTPSTQEQGFTVTKGGDIFLTGTYKSALYYNNGIVFNGGVNNRGYLLKLNTNGTVIWSQQVLSTSTAFTIPSDLVLSNDESYLLNTGFTASSFCFLCPNSGYQNTQIFVAKYDTQLGGLIDTIFSDPQTSNILTIETEVSDSGDVFLTFSFDKNFAVNGQLYTPTNFADVIFTKINRDFTWDFVRSLSSVNTTTISDILYKNGNVILAAEALEYIFLDSVNLLQGPLFSNIVLLQFSEDGTFEYFKTIRNLNSTFFNALKSVTGLADGEGDRYYAFGNYAFNGLFDNDTLFSNANTDLFWAEVSCTPKAFSQILGDTVVCLGQHNYSLPTSQFGPGIDYQWTVTDSNGVSIPFVQSDTFITVNFNTTGTYTITVAVFNNCGMSPVTTLMVNVIDIPAPPTINGDTIACLGQSAYNVPPNDFNTYTWSISSGGSVFPIGNTAIVNWAITGTYDVNVVASNICGTGAQSSFPVTIKAIPDAPSPIVGSNNICISTQTYSITNVADVSYNWSLSSGGTITSNGNIATVNWASAGNHTIIVTPTNECGTGASRTITVNVNDVPQQPSTVVGNLITCIGTESYSVVGNTSINYSWSLSGGGVINSAGSSAAVIWTTPGTHTLTITPSNVCGTGTPRTVNVIVRDVPTQPGNFIGLDTVCIGQQNYQVPVQQGTNYTWSLSGGGIVIPSNNAATIDWTTSGTHTLTVTPYNTCGTGQSRSFVVFVKNTNAAFNTIMGEDTVCLGIENYSVPNVNNLSYVWSVNGGGTLTAINNSAFVTWSGTGVYTLNVATSDGCNSALNVEVRDKPAQPTPIVGDTVVCVGTYNYGVFSEPNVNYSWTLSGGGILIENNNLATITWQTPGVYTLTVTPFNDCGTGTPQTISIDVRTIPNAPAAVTGDTLVCLGNEIYTVPVNNTVNYNWSLSNSGAVLIPTGNQATINWQTVDTTTITVTASNLCGTSPQTMLDVEVIDLPNTPTINGDTASCLVSKNYSVLAEAYTTYNWNLASGGSLNPANNTATVNWQNVGNHALTVSATNQCGTAIPSTISVNTIDVPVQPTAILGDSLVCQSLKSYAVPAAANTNYTWTLSSGGAISALGNVANVNWITPGVHTITVTPFNNCGTGTPITKTILVTGIPSSPSAITGTAVTCLSNTTYSIVNNPNVTYTWTLNGGGVLTQNGNTATVNWQVPGIYTLSVVPQTLCGVGTPSTLTIQVSDVPNIPQLITGDTSVCVGNQLYSISQVSGVNYTWVLSSGGNLNAAGNNATINWTTTGTHTLTITPSNSCGNGTPLIKTIQVSDIPNPVTAISGNTDICLGSENYTIPNVTGETYTWTLSSGGLLSANGNTATVNWLSNGSHTLSVVPSNGCGVAPLTSLVINVTSVPSQPNTISGMTNICENTSETYSITTVNNVNYTWSVSSGGTIIGTGNTATVNWTSPGLHTISVTPSNTCGTGVAQSRTVEVRANDLETSVITGDELVCNGSEVFYTADFSPDLDYEWFISGNGTLTQVSNSAVVQWQEAGTATIGLIPSSECGVGDTALITVIIEDPLPIPTLTFTGDSLVANTAQGIKWYVDQTIIPNNQSFLIPLTNGVYTITAENICGQTGFSNPVNFGVSEEGMYLYPNPASQFTVLHFPIYLRWYHFDIIDYSGRRLTDRVQYNGRNEIRVDLSKLESGIHIVRIYTELGWFFKKLVVAN